MNVFRSFFAFRLEMHVRCDNQYKTGADRGNILGQSRLFECMGICVLSPAHESEMRGYLVHVLIVKYLSLIHISEPTRHLVISYAVFCFVIVSCLEVFHFQG